MTDLELGAFRLSRSSRLRSLSIGPPCKNLMFINQPFALSRQTVFLGWVSFLPWASSPALVARTAAHPSVPAVARVRAVAAAPLVDPRAIPGVKPRASAEVDPRAIPGVKPRASAEVDL